MTPASSISPRRPGGSIVGRTQRRSRTRVAGVRFEWVLRACGPMLRVVATWTDKGTPRHTSFSVDAHGLEGALDLAIAARTSAGAPMPNRADLLERLQAELRTRAPASVAASPRRAELAEERYLA